MEAVKNRMEFWGSLIDKGCTVQSSRTHEGFRPVGVNFNSHKHVTSNTFYGVSF